MQNRIFSMAAALMAAGLSFTGTEFHATAQDSGGFVTDPATGIIYRPVTRTIERPVVETQIRKEERTVYRPETVTDTTTETRLLYTPVVEYRWEPRLHGRWNPFQQPTVAYHHVPTTRWETRSEVIPRTTLRTQYVAETRTVDVPYQVARIQRETRVDLEAVENVNRAAFGNVSTQVAARLRPLDRNEMVQALASTTQMASDTGGRTTTWGGIRATELQPTYSQPLPPPSTGVAGLPVLQMWR